MTPRPPMTTRLLSLMNMLLILELIIGPILPSLNILGSKVYANTCPQGFQWDSTLNRCLTSIETASIMNATSNCAPNDVQCYRSNAEAELKKKEDAGDVSKQIGNKTGFVSTVMDAAVVAVPITLGVAALRDQAETNSCSSISYYALVAGGVSLFVGDMFADDRHRSRLRKIKSDWDKILSPNAEDEEDSDNIKSNATEAQSQAFEMLARAEDSLAKTASTKKTFYSIAMGAFAVATGLALYEMMNPLTAGSSYCKTSEVSEETEMEFKSPEMETPKIDVNIETPEVELINPTGPEFTPTMRPPTGSIEVPNFKNKTEYTFHQIISKIYSRDQQRELFQDLSNLDQRLKKQKIYNLSQARSLPEFYVLHQEFSLSNSSSTEEFSSISSFIKKAALEDSELFSFVKLITLKLIQEVNPIPTANAQAKKVATAAIGVGAGLALKKTILPFLKTPGGRATIGGVFFGWSLVMNNHAKSQEKASKNRADLLRKMKDDFKSASGAINQCTSQDRNDPAKSQCYCYTSDGKRNPNRGNSKTCQQLFAGKDFTLGNYYGSDADKMQGCMDNKCSYDESCACKKTNTCGCMTSPRSSIKGIDPGSFSMLSSSLTPAANVTGSTASTAGIDAASLESNAMKIMDKNKKLEEKLGAKFKANKAKAAGILQKAANRAAASAPSNLLGSHPALPQNAKEAASLLEKEIDLQKIGEINGTGGTIGVAASKDEAPNLDFGFTADQGGIQKDQMAEAMKQELDYGQNDINKSSSNIFELLSHRYQRSGMRRLFDTNGVTQPDAAAKTDITK